MNLLEFLSVATALLFGIIAIVISIKDEKEKKSEAEEASLLPYDEEAKKQVRSHRDDVMKDLKTKEKAGGMGEDEVRRLEKEAQKMVDEINKKLEEFVLAAVIKKYNLAKISTWVKKHSGPKN